MTSKFQLIPVYYFGKDVIKDNLAKELKNHKVKKAFLPYGGGSIKRNGLYNEIINACKQAKVKLIEFQGIEPNPRDTTLDQAVVVARKEKVDLIIAAGGGSVIDAAKVIAAVTTNPQFKNVWSYVENNRCITKPALPIFTMVTLAATGSESNDSSVITNSKTKTKIGTSTESAMPLVSFEDPKFQLTLSK
jgi:alcohol dehydrogenase YqhD (iron-dependent ADH family)